MAPCRKPQNNRNSWDKHTTLSSRIQSQRPSSCLWSSRSTSRYRQSCHRVSHSSSINYFYSYRSLYHSDRRGSTPYRHQSWCSHKEGKLVIDTISDGHTSFHTTLQMISSQGSKPLSIKVDPSTDINITSLNRYCNFSPNISPKLVP